MAYISFGEPAWLVFAFGLGSSFGGGGQSKRTTKIITEL